MFFNDPQAISPDLLDPDSLAVTFIFPEVIVDQENYETLQESEWEQVVPLKP